MMDDTMLRVGAITKTHGLKGALKVYPTTDEPEVFVPGAGALIDTGDGLIPVTIETVSRFKNLYIMKFAEFSDINDAEPYKGLDLYMQKDALPALGEREYFISDLIDMEVFTEDEKRLGKVREVLSTGANDVYVVDGEDGDILLPAIGACIKEVHVEEKRMTVHLMPGLVD